MRQKLLILSILVTVVLLVVSITPVTSVQAETLLQQAPNLEGYRIYFADTNGEASRFDRTDNGLSRLGGLLQRLGADLFTLDWRKDVPPDANLIIIAGPLTDLSADQSARLWSYINNDGHVLLLADPLKINTSTRAFEMNPVLPATSGLFALTWSDLGLRGRSDVVVIENGPSVPPAAEGAPTNVPTGTGLGLEFSTNSLAADHPITAGLTDEVAFFGARSIEFDASIQQFVTTPLVFSAENFYGESNFAAYITDGTFEYNIGSDTTRGQQALIAAVQNERTGTRIVLIGDRDFATNGRGLQTSPPNTASFVYPGNVRLLLNAIGWLLSADANNSTELTFPTPGPTATVTITPSPTLSPTPAPTATPAA